KHDSFIGADEVYYAGLIEGDLTSSSKKLEVSGQIDGDLSYHSENEADFSNQANVKGVTEWTEIKTEAKQDSKSYAPTLLTALYSLLAALVVWLVIRFIRPNFWITFADKLLTSPLKSFGVGILALFVLPIVMLLLMITIIGIPLSLMLITAYLISLYLAKIIIAVFIGFWFQKKFAWSNAWVFWIFLGSLMIINILILLLFIGFFIRFLIFFLVVQ